MYNPNDFIENLSADIKPVKRLLSPMTRMSLWYGFCFLVVIVAMLGIQPFRPGFASQFGHFKFALETLFAFAPGLTLGLVALRLSVPGDSVSRLKLILYLLPAFLFPMFLLYGHWVEPSLAPTMAGKRPFCFYEILIGGWVPVAILFFLVRKGYAFGSRFHAFAIGFAGASIPAAMMQIACMYDPYHALTHHVYPLLVIAGVMALVAQPFLRSK